MKLENFKLRYVKIETLSRYFVKKFYINFFISQDISKNMSNVHDAKISKKSEVINFE